MQASLLALVIALTVMVSADFMASNTSVCMGAWPFGSCYEGVVVFTGVKNTTDYTCPKLKAAEDQSYINTHQMSYYGSANASADNVCGHGKLTFFRDDTSYFALDSNGNHVADCKNDTSLAAHCSQWVGALFFRSMYRCKSTITCE